MTALLAIQKIAAKKLDVTLEEIQSSSAKSWRETGLDSLALIDVVFAIERELDITVPDGLMEKATSLESLAAAVETLLHLQPSTVQSSVA